MINKLYEKMLEYGLETEIVPDGKIHRFKVGSDKGKSGWYVCHLEKDSFVASSFGDWRTGLNITFSDFEKSNCNQVEYRKKIAEIKKKAEEERKVVAEDAERRANSLWRQAEDVKEHPYLVNKKVGAHGIKKFNNSLVIPVRSMDKKIKSLQFIDESGDKKFLTGGEMKGNAFSIPGEMDIVYVCEGYSTGATIAEQTGNCVVCTFNASNLIPVCKGLREKLPETEVIIAADNDRRTQCLNKKCLCSCSLEDEVCQECGTIINIGRVKAKEAANIISGKTAIPEFDGEGTDFNDLHNQGVDIVPLLNGVDSSLFSEIKKFVKSTNGLIKLSEIINHFGYKEKQQRDLVLRIVEQLCKNNILRKHRTRSFTYKIINTEVKKQDLSADPVPLKVHLPFNLEDYVNIYKKTVIIIAGESNAGKTAASLECVASNVMAGHKNITYHSSEMSEDEYKARVLGLNPDRDFWDTVDFYDRASDFEDLIIGEKRDGIHVIDYLEPFGDSGYAGVEESITEIWNQLRDGVAIINLQKKDGQELAMGGNGTKTKSRLYLSLSKGYKSANEGWVNHCKIIKSKLPKDGCENVDGKACFYKVDHDGIRILSGWQYMNKDSEKRFITELKIDIPPAEQTDEVFRRMH